MNPTNTNTDERRPGGGGFPSSGAFPFPRFFGGGSDDDEGDSEGGIPVIVIRTRPSSGSGFNPFFGGNSGFPGFGSGSSRGGIDIRDLLNTFFGNGESPADGFIPAEVEGDEEDGGVVLVSDDDEQDEAVPRCGLICIMLREFQVRNCAL